MKHNNSFGMYIHIPFCVQKCKYCDFLSFADTKYQKEYIEAVIQEIQVWRGFGSISTIYFGGGTPSVLPVSYIEEILRTIRECFVVEDGAEITIECNPGTADRDKFRAYRSMGINRVSMGLQSAVDEELKLLGRIHTVRQFVESYQDARGAGFENINIDIMSAIPGQTMDSYTDTLKMVAELNPEHISSYSLIIEEGTPFFQLYEEGKLMLPDEECERQMYDITKQVLKSYGYERYEISNYAKPGYESKHNSSYWTRKNYLGIGLGASSLMDEIRFKNPDLKEVYIGRQFVQNRLENYEEVEKLSPKEQMEEFVFLGLRKMEGISILDFEEKFRESFANIYGKICRKFIQEGLLEKKGDRICLSEHGIDVSNYIFSEFL